MKWWHGLLAGMVLLALAAGAWFLFFGGEDPQVRASLTSMAGASIDSGSEGFLRVTEPQAFVFPADHGPHPGYQTEWWYYTGNLEADSGRRFGYQLTFFRRALTPPEAAADRDSEWATDQVYMAHLAISDIDGAEYKARERFARGAAGLAGARAEPFNVWLEDWQVEEVGPGVTRMQAADDGLALDLLLSDLKGPILQGDQGYSAKGPQPGNASYYYSLSRLQTEGTLQVGDAQHEVEGLSWMDHEWSTSALGAGQVGWDWFSIQLDDGSELMVFQLRQEDGSIDPFSSGTFIAADAATRQLGVESFEIRVQDTWRSPHTGAIYPSRWTITVPSEDLTLQIEPYLADQELTVSYAYWEGAVEATGTRAGQPVSGGGYAELTGYSGSMQGQF
jgi:predicted secreted hydrolase